MDNKEYKSFIIEKSTQFSLLLIRFISKLPKDSMIYSVIAKQLLRSGTSIGANIVESQASSSRKDFSNFISYALKSANETRYWLRILGESGMIRGPMLDKLKDEANELANMLGSSIMKLRSRH